MKRINTHKESDCVLIATDNIIEVSYDLIDNLKIMAKENGFNKSRLLLHNNKNEALHEMLIVHNTLPSERLKYIIPHKNASSPKSWQILEGEVVFVIFDDYGKVLKHYKVGNNSHNQSFMLRINENFYHTMIPITDVLVYIETILGPFEGRFEAPWAPKEEDKILAQEYVSNIYNLLHISK